jgi:hypothetical protein
MTAFILTEEPLQVAILERLVRSHPALGPQDIRVRYSEGDIAARARNHFMHSSNPVALVSSGYFLHPNDVRVEAALRESYLRGHVPHAKFLVFMVTPEIESLLFQDEGIVNAVLPGPVSIEDRVRGRYEPHKVLGELFSRAGEEDFTDALIQRLAHVDFSALWKLEMLKPLEDFLLEVTFGRASPSPTSP